MRALGARGGATHAKEGTSPTCCRLRQPSLSWLPPLHHWQSSLHMWGPEVFISSSPGYSPSPLTASSSHRPSLWRKTFQPPGPAQQPDNLGQTRLCHPMAVGLGEFGTSVFSSNACILNNYSVAIPMARAESTVRGVRPAPTSGLSFIRPFCRWPMEVYKR